MLRSIYILPIHSCAMFRVITTHGFISATKYMIMYASQNPDGFAKERFFAALRMTKQGIYSMISGHQSSSSYTASFPPWQILQPQVRMIKQVYEN